MRGLLILKSMTPIRSKGSALFGPAIIVQGLGAVLAYLSQVLLARSVSIETFGLVSATLSVSLLVGLACTAGMGTYALRRLPSMEAQDESAAIVRSVYVYCFAGSVLGAVCVGAVVYAVGWLSLPAAISAGVLCGAATLLNVGNDVGRGVGAFVETYGASVVLRPLVVTVFMLWALVVGVRVGLSESLSIIAIAAVSAVAVQVLAVLRRVPDARNGPRFLLPLRDLTLASLPFLMANGIVLLLLQVDLMVGALVLQGDELGKYAAALRTVAVISVATGAISTVGIPMIARAGAQVGELEVAARRVARWQSMMASAVALPLVLFPSAILGLFGSDYEGAAAVVRLLALGQLGTTLLGPAGTVLVYTGRPALATVGYAASVLLSAGACVLGGVLGGVVGMATGAALGLLLNGMLLSLICVRVLGVQVAFVGRSRGVQPV